MDLGIFLAAFGITLLELTETSAVGLALYADSKDAKAFLWVALGVLVVFIPTIFVGKAIFGFIPIIFHFSVPLMSSRIPLTNSLAWPEWPENPSCREIRSSCSGV